MGSWEQAQTESWLALSTGLGYQGSGGAMLDTLRLTEPRLVACRGWERDSRQENHLRRRRSGQLQRLVR